jgi:hypothetical protein
MSHGSGTVTNDAVLVAVPDRDFSSRIRPLIPRNLGIVIARIAELAYLEAVKRNRFERFLKAVSLTKRTKLYNSHAHVCILGQIEGNISLQTISSGTRPFYTHSDNGPALSASGEEKLSCMRRIGKRRSIEGLHKSRGKVAFEGGL